MSPTDVTLLRALLATGTEPVPGPHLAKLLGGVSRVAVWHHLQKLAREGCAIEAIPSHGYRLGTPPARHLHAGLLHAHLDPRRVPHVVCLDTTDSTNSEAERRLAAGDPVPLVILARTQTKGRGRRGRPWHSTANGNLYATFVFRPRTEPARLQDFTLWMGLSVCAAIEQHFRLRPGLKWPNDVHLDGRKVGGMLTEARIDADQVRDLVYGLGLNLNSRPGDFPPELRPLVTSLAAATGEPIDFNRFTAALLGQLLDAYDRFLDGSYRTTFADLWARYDILRGRAVTVIQGTRTVRGTATGIDAEGSLLVRTAAGVTERFRAGEVTLGKDAA